jgi:hypothetical protein
MAERFVNRNVGIGSSTHDIARQNLTDLSEDMIIADHALILRPQKFGALMQETTTNRGLTADGDHSVDVRR